MRVTTPEIDAKRRNPRSAPMSLPMTRSSFMLLTVGVYGRRRRVPIDRVLAVSIPPTPADIDTHVIGIDIASRSTYRLRHVEYLQSGSVLARSIERAAHVS